MMTLWSVHVRWLNSDNPDAPTLANIATRMQGHSTSSQVDYLTGRYLMSTTVTLEADTMDVAVRRAHYLLAEASKFTATSIHATAAPLGQAPE